MSRIERPPGTFLRLIFRAPIGVYRAGLGRWMSKRLLLLVHTGRKSGQPRYAVLEVVRHEDPSGTFLVPAAYGRSADWYRNILKIPAVTVNHRGEEHEMVAGTLPPEDAAEEFAAYAARYPRAARNLGNLLGIPFNDPAAVAQTIPLVALRPRCERPEDSV